jgi:hypothetical protein
VTVESVVFWDVALCVFCENRRFGGTCRLYFYPQAKSDVSSWFANNDLCSRNFSTLKTEEKGSS